MCVGYIAHRFQRDGQPRAVQPLPLPSRARHDTSSPPVSTRPAAAMPSCRRSSSGYRSVCARPNGTYYAEIRSGDERISRGTYGSAHEVASAA